MDAKTDRKIGNHTEEQMKKALEAVKAGKSIRQAATENGISFSTLQRYKAKDNPDRLTPNYAVRKIFTTEHEEALRDHYKKCASMFYGLSTKDCRRIAYDWAKMNNVPIPESWETYKMSGIDWLRGFRERFPDLRLRKPENCSLARVAAYNRETVKTFFDNLLNVLSRNPAFVDGTRIYNLDETATGTVQKNPGLLASKGKRNISKASKGEKGTLVTTCNIISAGGVALPPALVFPLKNINPRMKIGTPPGSLILASPTGWMNTESFVEVMKHFVQWSGSTKESPTVLIMDNDEAHVSIQALNLAKESGVNVVTLHPNTAAYLQPLDGIHGLFDSCYSSAMESWMTRNPGCPVTIYDIGALVGEAFEKCMTPDNIRQSFNKTGISPFDRDIFSEEDFLANSVTNRPAAEEPTGADSKRKKIVETEIKQENTEDDDNTDLTFLEDFEVDIDETTNESTDPIKTEELQEFQLTCSLDNSQMQTNRKRILHKDSESDDTEQQNKTEKRHAEDPDLSFFYSLMPDMKAMSRDQKRRFQIGVLQLAGDILQEK